MNQGHFRSLRYYLKKPHQAVSNVLRWASSEVVSEPFVFVMGPPRSGTTLLHRVILNHSRVVGFSEETGTFSIRSVDDYGRFSHFLDPQVHYNALRTTDSIAGFFAAMHFLSFDLPEGGVYVEKTPQHAKYLKYLHSRFPMARFVFSVRDPRDSLCSGRKAGNIPQAARVTRHARYFNKCVDPLIELSKLGGIEDRVILIRYEDLTRRSYEVVSQLMDFLGLPGEAERQLSAEAMTADRRARLPEFSRLGQPISDKTVGVWRDELRDYEAMQYQSISGARLRFFGYDLGAP